MGSASRDRMGERHEDLARRPAGDPNVILHYGITAGKTVFEPQPFENPLRGVPLLRRCRLVGLQDSVDDWNERAELRPLRSLGAHIAGRRRIAAHLGNRVPAQSENPRRLAPALPFDEDKPSNRCVNLHREHSRPSLFESDFEKVRPRKWPGFTPPRATALCRRSVAYYCSAAYILDIVERVTLAVNRIDIWLNRAKIAAALEAGGGSQRPDLDPVALSIEERPGGRSGENLGHFSSLVRVVVIARKLTYGKI